MNKLIAVTCEDDGGLDAQVSEHFGRCEYVTIVEVDGETIVGHRVERNPNANLHQPGTTPLFIRALHVNVVVSGGMGPKAVSIFRDSGIAVATGARGTVAQAVRAYLDGALAAVASCGHEHRECVGHRPKGRAGA